MVVFMIKFYVANYAILCFSMSILNSFLINNAIKKFQTLVLIIPLIVSFNYNYI